MALDQWLLDTAERTGEGFLRLYRWNPYCLSFGRNEPAARRYDRARIEARGISTVRRPTGGRAVWHARELTYAVAAPVDTFGDDPDRPLSRQAFNTIHATLLSAVRRLGAPVTMAIPAERGAKPAEHVGAGACFASAVGGELLVGQQKLLGSAQVRQGRAFLQHGSLLLEDDQQLVADLTIGEPITGHETTLRAATGRAVGFIEASLAITRAARHWSGEWHPSTGPAESELAGHVTRFRDPEWTWRR
jgi:lipoate-protein ligase A